MEKHFTVTQANNGSYFKSSAIIIRQRQRVFQFSLWSQLELQQSSETNDFHCLMVNCGMQTTVLCDLGVTDLASDPQSFEALRTPPPAPPLLGSRRGWLRVFSTACRRWAFWEL